MCLLSSNDSVLRQGQKGGFRILQGSQYFHGSIPFRTASVRRGIGNLQEGADPRGQGIKGTVIRLLRKGLGDGGGDNGFTETGEGMIEIIGEEAVEELHRGSGEFFGKAQDKLRQEFLGPDGDGRGNR